ncbi:MAG: ribosomal protein L7/L12 [Deltaproteobacteria bacterium]|nr:ribosomal protein L7/L12 [Deltaproteobacteria bacterium]
MGFGSNCAEGWGILCRDVEFPIPFFDDLSFSSPMAEFTHCPSCGKNLPQLSDLKFCPHCGASLASSPPSQVGGLDRLVAETKILPALQQGNKIGAIKAYRELTQAGLKEAMQQVEAIAAQYHVSPARGSGAWKSSGKSGCGCGTRLLFSLFVGFMLATAGLAIFPAIGKVSGPFVCDGGIVVNSNHYNPSPGTSVTTRHFYCPDYREVTLRVAFVSGLLYSFGTLVLVSLLSWLKNLGKKNPSDAVFERTPPP